MLPENEVVLEPLGFHQRSESPPVSCQRVEAAGFSQELDAVEVTLGGRQVERGSTVVVASFHVDRRRVKPVKVHGDQTQKLNSQVLFSASLENSSPILDKKPSENLS